MATALTRVGVVADRRNEAGQTAADIALELGQHSVITVLKEAASGLWNAVMNSDQATSRRLIETLWFRIDLHRDGTSLLTTASKQRRIPDKLTKTITERNQYVRLMHSALAGNVDEIRQQLQYLDCRSVALQLRDTRYRLDDGTVTEWPLLAQVLQLRLIDVARVLIEYANFDVNEVIVVDGGRTVPLFQWAVDPVVETNIAIYELILERADVSLLVEPADFVYELWQRRHPVTTSSGNDVIWQRRHLVTTSSGNDIIWQRRHPALLFDRFAARDLSLVSARDSHGRTLRDRVLLDSLEYGAADVVKISVQYVDEFVLNLIKTGKVSCLERLMMAGYENINVLDRYGKSASQIAADAKMSSVVDFLGKLPPFQVSL